MKKNWPFFLVCVFLLILGIVFFVKGNSKKSSDFPDNNSKEKIVAGGIIPHHLLADFAIEQFFAWEKTFSPETVVIIGPNHFEKGEMVLSTKVMWPTEKGIVEPETEIIKKLSENGLAILNEKILLEEHSINTIMPFIKTYFPKARVVPIIFRKNVGLTTLQILTDELLKNIHKKTIFIASVDFSHYLNSEESDKKDAESLSAMKNFDYSKLMSFESDHLDSPAAVVALLLLMQKNGYKDFEVLFHSNSGEILKNSSSPVTSYFTILF